jgi:hypothetical protein
MGVAHHLNPLKLDFLKIFNSSMYELLGVTILSLHGMYDNVNGWCKQNGWRRLPHLPQDFLLMASTLHLFYPCWSQKLL